MKFTKREIIAMLIGGLIFASILSKNVDEKETNSITEIAPIDSVLTEYNQSVIRETMLRYYRDYGLHDIQFKIEADRTLMISSYFSYSSSKGEVRRIVDNILRFTMTKIDRAPQAIIGQTNYNYHLQIIYLDSYGEFKRDYIANKHSDQYSIDWPSYFH